MKKIYFLVVNENLKNGLLQSQLVDPILRNFNPDEVIIICINRPFSKGYSHKILHIINLPFLIPFRFVNFSKFFFLNEVLCAFYAIIISFFVYDQSQLVCRSYVAGRIGTLVKKIKSIKLIFDPRSLYIHENIGLNKLKKKTVLFNYWVNLEKKILFNSDRIITVSKGQEDYYQSICNSNSKYVYIPCYSSCPEMLSGHERENLRKSFGINKNEILVVYFGSLNYGWNNVFLYEKYFEQLILLNHKILIVSQDKLFLQQKLNFSSDKVLIFDSNDAVKSFGSVSKLLQCADYGIVLLDKTPDWKTRLTVKFVDYVSNGIPVLVGRYVGEAVRLVNENKELDACIIVENHLELTELKLQNQTVRKNIRNWAFDKFSFSNLKKAICLD